MSPFITRRAFYCPIHCEQSTIAAGGQQSCKGAPHYTNRCNKYYCSMAGVVDVWQLEYFIADGHKKHYFTKKIDATNNKRISWTCRLWNIATVLRQWRGSSFAIARRNMNTFGRSMGAERREEAAHETQISSSSYIIIFFFVRWQQFGTVGPKLRKRQREGEWRAEKETNDVSVAVRVAAVSASDHNQQKLWLDIQMSR